MKGHACQEERTSVWIRDITAMATAGLTCWVPLSLTDLLKLKRRCFVPGMVHTLQRGLVLDIEPRGGHGVLRVRCSLEREVLNNQARNAASDGCSDSASSPFAGRSYVRCGLCSRNIPSFLGDGVQQSNPCWIPKACATAPGCHMLGSGTDIRWDPRSSEAASETLDSTSLRCEMIEQVLDILADMDFTDDEEPCALQTVEKWAGERGFWLAVEYICRLTTPCHSLRTSPEPQFLPQRGIMMMLIIFICIIIRFTLLPILVLLLLLFFE